MFASLLRSQTPIQFCKKANIRTLLTFQGLTNLRERTLTYITVHYAPYHQTTPATTTRLT